MKLLVLEARYYEDISSNLKKGCTAFLKEKDIKADFVTLKGALEIPAAIKISAAQKKYDGFVALGCVIRGQTTHYEIISEQSAAGLMALGVDYGLAIGNGILTVENKAQAEERADPKRGNKGKAAAEACLALLELK